jgi:uncharacterized membrane protein YhaH (DUF805 family)
MLQNLCYLYDRIVPFIIYIFGGIMTFNESIKICLTKNYAEFSGRASLSEYWWFWLFGVLINSAAAIINPSTSYMASGLVFLALLLPNVSVTTRRLHDVNRSGWWQLLYLTIIGGFVVLYWLCKKTSPISKY